MEPPIDLRSDTMTRASQRMRQAMADAAVGNSALGEDPTVERLEQDAAERLGKEDALFLASGTMGNLAAMLAWTRDVERPEIIAESTAHVLLYESSSISRIAHAQARAIQGQRGVMDPAEVERHLRPSDGPSIKPQTALVCLEQTHNQAGGTVLAPDHMAEIRELASAHDVPLHIDGARLFNAAVALDVPVAELAQHGDSVMIALTKGLGAPVGSILAGPEPFIERAARAKALLGGAMRQAGHLAAAGLVALEDGPDRLHRDHENAERLAEGLAKIDGVSVDLDRVETNIVFFDVSPLGMTAPEFQDAMLEADVGVDGMMRPTHVRAVTHRDVSADDVDRAIEAAANVAAEHR